MANIGAYISLIQYSLQIHPKGKIKDRNNKHTSR
jgi:hypothetical protein